MKVCGIICEFNPFHRGHKHLIDSVRAGYGADAVVCVMSGEFVQRGAPAVADKFVRAEAAVRCGADLVLELPFCYAVNGAAEFAKGGIRILKGLGCVDALAFGSESGDAEALKRAAELLSSESEEFKEALRSGLDSGLPYPESYSKAAVRLGVEVYGGSTPNDMLAAEYIKQCEAQGFSPELICVKRAGAEHSDDSCAEESMSAAGIRKLIASAKSRGEALGLISSRVPKGSLEALSRGKLWDAGCGERLFTVLRHELITCGAERIAEALEAGEGIENRLIRAAVTAEDADGLMLAAKTRRYTYSRISRVLMQLLAGLTKERYAAIDREETAYARVLAFDDAGAALLRRISGSAPMSVYTNLNKRRPEREGEKLSLELDILASDIYSNLTGKKLYDGSDLTCNPVRVRV